MLDERFSEFFSQTRQLDFTNDQNWAMYLYFKSRLTGRRKDDHNGREIGWSREEDKPSDEDLINNPLSFSGFLGE